MPQACDTQSLVDAAACLEQCVPIGFHPAIQTYLLMQIAGLNLTPEQLIDAAKCYQCLNGMQMEAQLYLLCQIANQ